MIQASSHLQTLGVCLEKPHSSCTSPGAAQVLEQKGCFAFLRLFWVAGSSQGKNHPCPSPPILWALHIRGPRLLCGLRVGSHPWSLRPALLPFRLILRTRAGFEGPMGRGKRSHPEVFLSLWWCSPAAFLPPHLPSWQAAQLVPRHLWIQDSIWPSQVITKA